MQTQFAAKSTMIRQHIDRQMPWTESVLKLPSSELIQLRLDGKLGNLPSICVLRACGIPVSPDIPSASALEVTRIETPPGYLPSVTLCSMRATHVVTQVQTNYWAPQWLDCPVAIHISGLPRPIVLLHIPFIEGGEAKGDWREVIVLAKEDAGCFLAKLQEVMNAPAATVNVLDMGVRPVAATRWDDLTLDEGVVALLRDDYESFFSREEWFRAHRLPYRRGYLLHGPPGNGKTSAIRAMLSRPGVNGHTVNLFQRDLTDNELMDMFHVAGQETPALIVLEDLDRCLPEKREDDWNVRVNMQTLLNCLDGITTQDGMIVVATANDPARLDSAILQRPGRFDRVVEFPNPTAALRARYFHHLFRDSIGEEVVVAVEASEGFSFAQLRESYVLAGQTAFAEDRQIRGSDIVCGMRTLRATMKAAIKKPAGKAGFRTARRAGLD